MSLYAFSEINDLKVKIIQFANEWVKKEKTPIPKKVIIEGLEKMGENPYTVTNALIVLVKKGYLTRAKVYGLGDGLKTYYKVLRTV